MNLYELNVAMTNLLDAMDQMENTEDKILIKNSIDQLQMQTTEKIENLIKYIKNLEAEAKALTEEAKRLTDRKKATENKIDRLKDYLKDFTSNLEGKKYNTGIFNLSIRKNPVSVNVVDLKAIPRKFITVETVEKINKKDIAAAFKNGEEVPGAELIKSESLNIK